MNVAPGLHARCSHSPALHLLPDSPDGLAQIGGLRIGPIATGGAGRARAQGLREVVPLRPLLADVLVPLTLREGDELGMTLADGVGDVAGVPVVRVEELLGQVGLMPLADKPVGVLAYGQKRALELSLALALDPPVMLLDEPTAGMGTEDVDRTIDLVRRIAAGRTVVLVDHNMHVVGSLADRVTVLQQGRILAEGDYDSVRTDERVITAYLGRADHA